MNVKILESDDLAKSCEMLIKQGGLFKTEKQASFFISQIKKAPLLMSNLKIYDEIGVITSSKWASGNTFFKNYYLIDQYGVTEKIIGFWQEEIDRNEMKRIEKKYDVTFQDEGIIDNEKGIWVPDKLRNEIKMKTKKRTPEKLKSKWVRKQIKMSSMFIGNIVDKIISSQHE